MPFQVLFYFGDEAKYCKVKDGATQAEIITQFHKVFDDRSGDILQKQESVSTNNFAWVNVENNFKLSTDNAILRLISSKVKKLRLGNLSPSTSVIFCCDMQEKFRPAIQYFDECVKVGNRILKAANLLNVPVVVTEQYPRGLGNTVSQLEINDSILKVDKTKFSMLVPKVTEFLDGLPLAKSVVLFGVEAHVCIQQTVFDLLSRGYEVHVVADATSSRSSSDRQLAFERIRQVGAFVTSCETVLLQWVADKNHEHFKAISNLIKELPPDTGLLVKSSM